VRLLTRTCACVLATAVLVAVAVVPLRAFGTPSTPEIEAKQAEAAAAQAQLDELQAQLELRTEEYGAVTAELQVTRDEIAKTRRELEQADAQLERATGLLEKRAAGIYRSGNVELLDVLLGTSSFQDFLTRVEWLRRVNVSDAEIVAAVKDARERVQQAEDALERREQEQITLRDHAAVKKKEMEGAVSQQREFLEGLNSDIAQLVEEERVRQEQLAAERARLAQEAAERAQAALLGSASDPTPVDAGSLGQGHPEALSVGLKHVGVPYVWGGATPAGFDCSGLTQYVYGEIGIALPRTSRDQYLVGGAIPTDRLDLLVAGDLVFFGYGGDPNRVHHVGIYAGGGDFLHAPQTGQTVQVSSLLDRIESRKDYVGARRP